MTSREPWPAANHDQPGGLTSSEPSGHIYGILSIPLDNVLATGKVEWLGY
jgi:hypothetical protein